MKARFQVPLQYDAVSEIHQYHTKVSIVFVGVFFFKVHTHTHTHTHTSIVLIVHWLSIPGVAYDFQILSQTFIFSLIVISIFVLYIAIYLI